MMPKARQRRPDAFVQLYFVLALLSGCAAMFLLFNNPSEAASAWVFGLSKSRAVLAAALLLWIFAAAVLVRRSSVWQDRILTGLRKRWVYRVGLLSSSVGLVVGSQIWHLANVVADPYVRGLLVRLVPVLLLVTLFGLQNLLLLPLLHHGSDHLRGALSSKTLRIGGIIFGLFILIWAVIALTGLGITPDAIGWDAPGVPVTVASVGLAGLVGIIWLCLPINDIRKNLFIDILLGLIIWGAAALLWSGQPMQPDYFAPAPQPPNFEHYPHSDAATHDVLAQGLLIGEGFPGVARKPLYALFLALLHQIAGQDYQQVIFLQILVVALLPVGVYGLGKTLHHRVSGIVAAILVILRERNAIALSGTIGVSHVKLLMSDLPATLGVVALTLLLVAWLEKPDQRRAYPFALGGLLGLLLLMRPQVVVLVPVIFLFVMGIFIRRPGVALRHVGILSLGLALTLIPWLWRSYQITGQYVLNDPNQNAFLTQQYSLTPGYDPLQRFPGETDGEFAQRVDDYLSEFMRTNPGLVASFVVSHFSHSLVEMVITLPMSPWVVSDAGSDLFPNWVQQSERLWEECCSPQAYVGSQPFWSAWQGSLTGEMILMLTLNLAIVAVGMSAAITRRDILGVIPLGVGLTYVLSTAVGRYSGWRLILPADWALFLYYALGLGQLLLWAKTYLTRRIPNDELPHLNEPTWTRTLKLADRTLPSLRMLVVPGLIFLGLGLSPILVEKLIPPRYDEISIADVGNYLQEIPAAANLLEDEDLIVLQGRVLYPRFYRPGKGEPGNAWPAFGERTFSRLGFILLSSVRSDVIFPIEESPEFFPNAVDAIVLGCPANDYIGALAGQTHHKSRQLGLTNRVSSLESIRGVPNGNKRRYRRTLW